ncbi:hypothetical protein HYH03_016500 [Edaphochlamys debaryana]|uniref:Uncharacterized protein n=1 Tax=Edaphochlamys debaryana TaxID=47281 RepID=A0A836BRL2_9CHLO|nr:hypothetical protein HYH03_016500 [Edaphochlamys debaryana]|eukprot:KAG2484753.1 hypothetical protein HYH03_016500 [Edaphochlamys debaryana]
MGGLAKLRAKSFRRRSLLGLYVRNLAAMKEGAAESAAARNEAYALALQEHAATDAAISHAVGTAAEGGDDGGEASGAGGGGRALQAVRRDGAGRSGAVSTGREHVAEYDGGVQQATGQPPSGAHVGALDDQAPPPPMLDPLGLQQPLPLLNWRETWPLGTQPLHAVPSRLQGGDSSEAASGPRAWPLSWDGGRGEPERRAGGFAGAGPSGSRAAAAALAADGSAWGGGGGTGWAVEGAEDGSGGAEALDGMQTDYEARVFGAPQWGSLGADALSLEQAWAPPQMAGGWAGSEHAGATHSGSRPHGRRNAEILPLAASADGWADRAERLPLGGWGGQGLAPLARLQDPSTHTEAAVSAGGDGTQQGLAGQPIGGSTMPGAFAAMQFGRQAAARPPWTPDSKAFSGGQDTARQVATCAHQSRSAPDGFPAALRSWGLRELCFPETWMPPPGPHWRHTAPPVPSKALGAGIAAAVEEFEGPPVAVQELLGYSGILPPPEGGVPTLFRFLNGKPRT